MFVQRILVSESYKTLLLEIGDEGGLSRQAITMKELEKFKIPLPTLEKQKKIVIEIKKQEAIIEENKKKIEDLQSQKQVIIK